MGNHSQWSGPTISHDEEETNRTLGNHSQWSGPNISLNEDEPEPQVGLFIIFI